MNKKFTIGADPELFIIDTSAENKVISSIGIIPGKKNDAWRGDDMPEGFGIETDNILAEFNIPPCKTMEGFITNIEYMKDYLDKFVKNINPDYSIQCIASRQVTKDQLQSPEAKQFGCDVDYNVYTCAPNPKPKGAKTNTRSAGFHIHVGYPDPNVEESLYYIKRLDRTLGLYSIIVDNDTKRRTLYGKAGAFRLTDYGLEYRVLSSYMMSDTKILTNIWKLLEYALDSRYDNIDGIFSDEQIESIINESNRDLAIEYFSKISYLKNLNLCAELQA